MRIVITGGTGLIGRALSAALAADNHQVVVLSRSPDANPPMPASIQVVGWDAHTATGWARWADGADAIVNLAGASLNRRWTPRNKRIIRESRLNAGAAVVDAVQRAQVKPRVVIQASGAGCYGPRGDKVITETIGYGGGFLGRTAAEWEASTDRLEDLGVRRAVIRSGVVFSTEGGILPLMTLPFRLFLGSILGSGDQWLPWIHMQDEVRAIRFLIQDDGAAGPFNLTAPHPVTNAHFSRVLARALHRPVFFRVPSVALRLVLGELSSVVVTGQRAVPERLLELGFKFRYPRLEPALKDLL